MLIHHLLSLKEEGEGFYRSEEELYAQVLPASPARFSGKIQGVFFLTGVNISSKYDQLQAERRETGSPEYQQPSVCR